MADHTTDPDERPAPPASAPPPERKRRRKWPWIILSTIVLGPILVMAAWAAITLNYTYSKGQRAGYVQKFSQKGWLCKTWEGELAMVNIPGQAQERWNFTVRDDRVAQQIQGLLGQRVALTYEEHKGVPTSCFGETDYYVTEFHSVEPPTMAPGTPGMPVPGAVPAPVPTPPTPTPVPPPTPRRP